LSKPSVQGSDHEPDEPDEPEEPDVVDADPPPVVADALHPAQEEEVQLPLAVPVLADAEAVQSLKDEDDNVPPLTDPVLAAADALRVTDALLLAPLALVVSDVLETALLMEAADELVGSEGSSRLVLDPEPPLVAVDDSTPDDDVAPATLAPSFPNGN
jgi:hypothetical protein